MAERSKTAYVDEDIVVISPREHIRRRPKMYVGGTDSHALHHMIYEVIDNSIDQAFAGQCDHIWVTLRENDVVSIRDNGPGISTSVNQHGRSQLEIVMTDRGMCGRKIGGGEEYHVSGGLHGVGLSAINALSEWMSVEVVQEGNLWEQHYCEGAVQNQVTLIRSLDAGVETGITFTFRPDFTIFEPNHFSYQELAKRFQEISYLVKGLAITLRDERVSPYVEVVYRYEDGLFDYVKQKNGDLETLHAPIHEQFEVSVPRKHYDPYTIQVEFVLQYSNTTASSIRSFANSVEVPHGGEHIQAVQAALANRFNNYIAIRNPNYNDEFSAREITSGLTLVMHILHPSPSFESNTKLRLMVEPELYGAVSQAAFHAGNQIINDIQAVIQLTELFEDNRFVTNGGYC